MLALCKVEATAGGLALIERDVAEAGDGEIRIRVKAAGICGTDMQIYHWAPRMARRMALPRVMGHELSGVVESLGSGVSNVAVGDHVSLESHIFCGICRQCRLGRAHLCEDTRYPGIDIDGGFASHVVVPAQIAWKNPPDFPHEQAAALEPFGIAVHASLEGSGVSGQTVLVNGCGPIGLFNVAAARVLGAAAVIAVDVHPLRLRCAAQLGADRVVNAREEDVAAVARDMTRGAGVDVAIEYSGTPEGFATALASLCKGGDFRLVGAPPRPIEVDFTHWLRNCPRVYNIHGRRIWETWERATGLVYSGQVDLSPVLSHVLPLSEGLRGFELILKGEAAKPILVPD
jgi:threonine 3-dehydrogenase